MLHLDWIGRGFVCVCNAYVFVLSRIILLRILIRFDTFQSNPFESNPIQSIRIQSNPIRRYESEVFKAFMTENGQLVICPNPACKECMEVVQRQNLRPPEVRLLFLVVLADLYCAFLFLLLPLSPSFLSHLYVSQSNPIQDHYYPIQYNPIQKRKQRGGQKRECQE